MSHTKHKKPYLIKIATEKNDFDLLGAIKDVDLIGSEFKKHKSCYKSYTWSAKNNSEPSYKKGNFEAVCNVVEDEVIFESKSFSIDALLNLFRWFKAIQILSKKTNWM